MWCIMDDVWGPEEIHDVCGLFMVEEREIEGWMDEAFQS